MRMLWGKRPSVLMLRALLELAILVDFRGLDALWYYLR